MDETDDNILNSTMEQININLIACKNSSDGQNNLLNEILNRIDKLEKTYTSVNTDLIIQNIKMSEILNGKLEEPKFEIPSSSNTEQSHDNTQCKEKELYFYERNGMFSIHGSGTFDNKSKIKSLGNCEWSSFNKTWDVLTSREKLYEIFPNIIEKEK